MLKRILIVTLPALLLCSCQHKDAAPARAEAPWRPLPLITNNQIDPAWQFTGFGSFAVDGDALRAEPDARGLGLLFYAKETFGDCQLRIVYRLKHPTANSGVYVRIADGILSQAGNASNPATRDAAGKLTPDGAKAMEAASENETGAWYAVHNGYEVQIADGGDTDHRTGAVYSYSSAATLPQPGKSPDPSSPVRTMIITLKGEQITVNVDGQPISRFNAADNDTPYRNAWHEPKREPKRPTHGYVGLQTHDPGDVVWFYEVSVKPLDR